MKLSDYVIQFFVDLGVTHTYAISGGAVIHLCDSAAKNDKIELIFTQHEQGAGAAVDMYARVTGNIGLGLVTSGPGATNLVTSVCNAYFDSIPCVFISGQVATARLRPNERLRQRGFQETDVVSIFRSITKYSVLVRRAEDIRFELEKAVYLARHGRPGPVLIDLPDDLQRLDVAPERLRSFAPTDEVSLTHRKSVTEETVAKVESLIAASKRPVMIVGAGVHCARVEAKAIEFAERYHLPLLLTWGALDLVESSHPLNMGGLGVAGPRAGNFAAQTSDLVVAVGTRLSQMITGGKQDLFAPHAKKVMIDIDPEELRKFGPDTFVLDEAIEADLRDWFGAFDSRPQQGDRFQDWRNQIREWSAKYPICQPSDRTRKGRVSAYVFMEALSSASKDGDIIVTDAGGNLAWTMQGIAVKDRQRVYSAWNHSPMGYSMPAAMGASAASSENVICIIGDGGIMMCLEELGTIKRHEMPIKIFIFNNRGHGIQKQTMETWLSAHYVGVDQATGLFFPDYRSVALAFGMEYREILTNADLPMLAEILKTEAPVLINVEIAEDQRIVPMLKFGAGLEDLDPKISGDELKQILSVVERFN